MLGTVRKAGTVEITKLATAKMIPILIINERILATSDDCSTCMRKMERPIIEGGSEGIMIKVAV